jgi:hypothetical protein
MAADIEQALIEKVRLLAPEQQRAVLGFVDELCQREQAFAADDQRMKPIWEVLTEISERVPKEAWEQLPADGAEQHDHYLYGTPKR